MDAEAVGKVPEEVMLLTARFLEREGCPEEGVSVGIQGGYGRGEYSERSDIDLILAALRPEDEPRKLRGSRQFEGRSFEVRTLVLDGLYVGRWEDKRRYLYANETLVYRDPSGALADLIRKAGMTREERTKAVVLAVRKLANVGLVYHNYQGKQWRNYTWEAMEDYWVDRGDLVSAQARLNEGAARVAALVFAVNGQFLPSLKWRYHILMRLPWLPPGFEADFRELLLTGSFGEEDYRRRIRAGLKILDRCVDKAQEDGHFPEDFGGYYRSFCPGYSDNME